MLSPADNLPLETNESIFLHVITVLSCPHQQKATKKTDKVWPDELDVTVLTDQDLKDHLLKCGVDVGPIVGECSNKHRQQHGYDLKAKSTLKTDFD